MPQTHNPGARGPGRAPDADAVGARADAVATLDQVLLALRRHALRPPVELSLMSGVRRPDFSVLVACTILASPAEGDGPPTVKSVAAAMDLDHSTASRIVSEGEAQGLIRRLPHPADRRSSVLALTEEGCAAVEEFGHVRRGVLASFTEGWSDEDVVTLTRLLSRFVDQIGACRAAMHAPGTADAS